jgi:hypothetical protein
MKHNLLKRVAQAVDLNGEGGSDLIVTKMTGGVAQTKARVHLHA